MGLSLVAALSLSACRHPGPTTADPTLGTGKGVAKGTGKGAKKLGPANPAAGTATAANRPPNSSDPPPMKKFSELIKKAKKRTGLFETYQRGEEVFLVLPKSVLGQDFLLHTYVSQGVGIRGLISGYRLDGQDALIVRFERHGDRVFLLQRPMHYRSPSDEAARLAVEQSYGPSVIQAAAVESEREDGAAVVNLKSWVLGDLSTIGKLVKRLERPLHVLTGTGSRAMPPAPNKDRSYVESVKSFSDNLSLRARLTFTLPELDDLPTVPDDRFLSLLVRYTFARLPEQPLPPRAADDRVGYFLTTRLDPGADEHDFYARHIHRWRLEPEQSADVAPGQLVAPRRPITFYIDPSFPAELRPYVKEGIESWNAAFAEAGFKNAVRAETLPAGADPDDIRYPTIRWDASLEAPLGRGMAITDPRSGEIVGASIVVNISVLKRFREHDLGLLGAPRTSFAAREAAASAAPPRAGSSNDGLDGEDFGEGMSAQAELLHTTLLANGLLLPGEPVPLRLLGQAVRFTAMHEVGHTLGLRHNFRASGATPRARLADPVWIREHGLAASVMDYPGLNLPAGPPPSDFSYYPEGIGTADRFAIAFGYSTDDDRAKGLARQAGSPERAFATDEDLDHHDPLVHSWDLSDDPLGWAEERLALIAKLHPSLRERTLPDNAAYGDLDRAFVVLVQEKLRALRIALSYLGGMHQSRTHLGDLGAQPPFLPVDRARQKTALTLLTSQVFSESATQLPKELREILGAPRFRGFDADRRPAATLASWEVLPEVILDDVLSPTVLRRLQDTERRFGAAQSLGLPEVFDALTRSIFSEILTGPARPVTLQRRHLQRAYAELLMELLFARGRIATDAAPLCRSQLVELRKRLDAAEKQRVATAADPHTRAHLQDLVSRIGKVLDAQVHAPGPG